MSHRWEGRRADVRGKQFDFTDVLISHVVVDRDDVPLVLYLDDDVVVPWHAVHIIAFEPGGAS